MKRIISIILVACLVLSLLAGISFSVFGESAGIAFTGLGEVAPGATIDTEQISGAPEGFVLHAMLSEYKYETGWFDMVEDGVVGQKGVYELALVMWGENGAAMTWDQYEQLCEYATIDGMGFDYVTTQNCDDKFVYEVAFYKIFLVGDIQIIDTVSFDALPPVEAGTVADLSQVRLADSVVGCFIDEGSHWYCSSGDKEMPPVLEDGYSYHLVLNLRPYEGYWFGWDLRCDAPMQEEAAFTDYVWGLGVVDFYYNLSKELTRLDICVDANPQYGAPIEAPAISTDAETELNILSHWSVSGWDGYEEVEEGTFGYGEYSLFITVQTKNNSTFLQPIELLINGEPYYMQGNVELWSDSDQHVTVRLSYMIAPPNGFVEYFCLAGAPGNVQPGAAITVPDIQVKEGTVMVGDVSWVDQDYNPVTGKFAKGEKYFLAISVVPQEGYAILSGENFEVQTDDGSYHHAWIHGEADGTGVIYMEYNLQPTVDKVEIQVAAPQIGAAPAAPTVPAGSKYSVQDYHWYEYDSGEPVVKFEDGKKYCIEVTVALAEGYQTGEEFVITFNGQEPYNQGWGENEVFAAQTFSFKKQLDRVDITLPVPELGGTADVDGIRLPENAKYSFGHAPYWSGDTSEFNGTFGKDKYHLQMSVIAHEGYEFSQNTQVYINGQLWNETFLYRDGLCVEAYYSISFRDVLKEVTLPELPADIQPGDAIVLPEPIENEKYRVYAMWEISQDGYSLEPVYEGAFQDKAAYYLVYIIETAPGYELASDVKFLSGSKVVNGLHVGSETYMGFAKLYALGLEVIDSVDITVPTPEAGKKPGQPTVPENAPYSIDDFGWGFSDSDKEGEEEYMEKDELVLAGKHYWISGAIKAKEGYVFSDTAVIRINGKEMAYDSLFGMPATLGDMGLFYAYAGQAKEAAPTPIIPPTGDMMPVVLLVLMLMSMAAIPAVIRGKKYLAK